MRRTIGEGIANGRLSRGAALWSRRRLLERGAGSVAAFAILSSPAKAAEFEFKCASELPVTHPISKRMGEMWATVEQETGGRLRVQFFPASILGNNAAMLNQLRIGALQFLSMNPGNLSAEVPAFNFGYLGFAYKDADEGLRVMDGALGAYLQQESAAKGMLLFRNAWDLGMLQIGANPHPIKTPADLRGFKVRVPETKITVDLFKALGASPTPLPYQEVYSSLQTKLIDGEAGATVGVKLASKFNEVEKYVSLTNHGWACEWLLANAEVWKTLPADVQAVVQRNSVRFAGLERRDNKAFEASAVAQIEKLGVIVNPCDQMPFRRALTNYYQEWREFFGPTAWSVLETALGHKLG